jgi:putative transposase
MPRIARIVVPSQPHHVIQRGNNRQDVFFVDDDRRVYIELLRDHAQRFGFSVLGYCLMTNHVHIIGTPEREDSLAKAIGRTHFRYTQYVNRLHGRVGHLWQNRFFSCTLDEVHCGRAMVYVERNPVRARMVRKAWRYAWSSASAHTGEADRTGLLDVRRRGREWKPGEWKRALEQPQDEAELSSIRLATHRGRPLASDSLLSKLERRLGRRLRPGPLGHPKKQATPPEGKVNKSGKGKQ